MRAAAVEQTGGNHALYVQFMIYGYVGATRETRVAAGKHALSIMHD